MKVKPFFHFYEKTGHSTSRGSVSRDAGTGKSREIRDSWQSYLEISVLCLRRRLPDYVGLSQKKVFKRKLEIFLFTLVCPGVISLILYLGQKKSPNIYKSYSILFRLIYHCAKFH